jgi:hypothetical protein
MDSICVDTYCTNEEIGLSETSEFDNKFDTVENIIDELDLTRPSTGS